jgi:hypothetical protein
MSAGCILRKGRPDLFLFALFKEESIADDAGIGDKEGAHGEEIRQPHAVMREEEIGEPEIDEKGHAEVYGSAQGS